MKKHLKLLIAATVFVMTLIMAGCGEEPVDLSGSYQDEVSQRASMEIVQSGDAYEIEVAWSSSAWETSIWKMTGTYADGKLSYEDGILENVTYDEDGSETVKMIEENMKGSFTLTEDGKLSWDANEGDSVFVKMEQEE